MACVALQVEGVSLAVPKVELVGGSKQERLYKALAVRGTPQSLFSSERVRGVEFACCSRFAIPSFILYSVERAICQYRVYRELALLLRTDQLVLLFLSLVLLIVRILVQLDLLNC